MRFLPIVERELRLTARRSGSYWARSFTAIAGLAIAAGTIVMQLGAGSLPGEIGETLFFVLSLIAFGLALFVGPFITADCLASEKRQGTLGLLFLTRLRSHNIVLGKLVSTSLPAFFWPLALIPVMALCFPLGGLNQPTFWRMALSLLVTLVFSLSCGLFMSSICRAGYRAVMATLAAVVAISFGIPALVLLASPAELLLPLSPAAACWFSLDANHAAAPWQHPASILGVLLESGLFVAGAISILPLSRTATARKPSSLRLFEFIGNIGLAPPRGKERSEMLSENPILWLAARHRRKRGFLWFAFAVVVTGALGAIQLLPANLPRAPLLFFSLFGLHTVVKLWIARTACHQFADDRQSGALELLLTSPLPERAIIQGWLSGLKKRFLGPVVAIASIDLTLFLTGLDGGVTTELDIAFLATIGLFIADTYTLCWVGFWFGLNSRTATRAFYRTIGFVLALPWVAFLGVIGALGLFSSFGAAPSPSSLAIVWFIAGYLTDLAFCGWAISRLDAGFREASVSRKPSEETRRIWDALRWPPSFSPGP